MTSYKCHLCYAYFNLEDSEKFKFHVFTHEKKGQSSTQCIQCGEQFQSKTMLKRHLVKKGQFHDDNCSQCGSEMKCYQDYQNHVKNEHENKWIYKCGFCAEMFVDSKTMDTHAFENHTKKGMNMKIKKETPKVKKPKQVCEDCGTSVTNLKTHMEAVHGDGLKR